MNTNTNKNAVTVHAPRRQAIRVHFLPPTNHSGARWKARCEAGAVTLAQDYELNADENAARAVRRLLDRLEWDTESYAGDWYGSSLHDGSYAFVWVGK